MLNVKSGNVIGVIVICRLFPTISFLTPWHAHGKFMNINPHCFTRYLTIFTISSDSTYWNNRYNIVYICVFRICIVYFPLVIVYTISLYTSTIYDIFLFRIHYYGMNHALQYIQLDLKKSSTRRSDIVVDLNLILKNLKLIL